MERQTVRQLIEKQADRYGEKAFFISPDTEREISYRELDSLINKSANLMQKYGVEKGDKIALLLPNLPEFIFNYLGAMKIGAVAGPVNILLKAQEIKFILQNSETKLLFTTPELWELVEPIRAELPGLKEIFIVGDQEIEGTLNYYNQLALMSELLSEVPLSADDEAMIIYTSGTTGNPKGVMLTHHNLIMDAKYITEWHSFTDSDRAMCILPLFHVNGEIVTVMTPLYHGGSLVMPEKFSASRFWETIAKYKINWFSTVPTILTILLQTKKDKSHLDLTSLRFCICGAAPLPVEVHKQFEESFGIYVIEGYGLSETTCYSSFNYHPPKEELKLGFSDPKYRKIGSIGVPVGNEMKIFDDFDNELPNYQRGEIVIRGENVMKGYFKNPEANDKTFSSGWFHSGDIGYRDGDGFFFITDRKKDMIIRGGENIYPREIDEVLYQHPKLLEAATVGIPDKKYGEEVKSFVVLKAGETASEQEILDFLKERVADFKCPKYIDFIDEIPKGPSGKLLKRKLLEMYVLISAVND